MSVSDRPTTAAIQAQHLLFPAPMPVFPTAGSLQEVLELGESMLPITNKNELHSLLMTYHNTLLAQVAIAAGASSFEEIN